jgi:hypothetical protein
MILPILPSARFKADSLLPEPAREASASRISRTAENKSDCIVTNLLSIFCQSVSRWRCCAAALAATACCLSTSVSISLRICLAFWFSVISPSGSNFPTQRPMPCATISATDWGSPDRLTETSDTLNDSTSLRAASNLSSLLLRPALDVPHNCSRNSRSF